MSALSKLVDWLFISIQNWTVAVPSGRPHGALKFFSKREIYSCRMALVIIMFCCLAHVGQCSFHISAQQRKSVSPRKHSKFSEMMRHHPCRHLGYVFKCAQSQECFLPTLPSGSSVHVRCTHGISCNGLVHEHACPLCFFFVEVAVRSQSFGLLGSKSSLTLSVPNSF
jgi:hypothetical protein